MVLSIFLVACVRLTPMAGLAARRPNSLRWQALQERGLDKSTAATMAVTLMAWPLTAQWGRVVKA